MSKKLRLSTLFFVDIFNVLIIKGLFASVKKVSICMKFSVYQCLGRFPKNFPQSYPQFLWVS